MGCLQQTATLLHAQTSLGLCSSYWARLVRFQYAVGPNTANHIAVLLLMREVKHPIYESWARQVDLARIPLGHLFGRTCVSWLKIRVW